MQITGTGVTPFQCSPWCSYFKVTRVVRHLVGAQQSVSMNFKSRQRGSFRVDDIEGLSCLGGWTSGIICLFQGVPGAAGDIPGVTMSFEMDRFYQIKRPLELQQTAQSI